MNTLSRFALLFAAMVALGPIFAMAQVRPPVPNRPPPSSPGSARMRGPTWNALETAEIEPNRPGAGVRVPAPPPEPESPFVRPPRFLNGDGTPYSGPVIGPPASPGPATEPSPGPMPSWMARAPWFPSASSSAATPVIPRPQVAPGPQAAPAPGPQTAPTPAPYGYPSVGPSSPAPAHGPASIVPHSQPPGDHGVPPGTPWTPGAVDVYQNRAPSGPPVPQVRRPPTYDPVGCPSCGGGMQHRSDALSVGPDGRAYNEGPIEPNPGGLPLPQGGLQHSWQACVTCGTARDGVVSARGELDNAARTARRFDMMQGMRSNCASGQCSRVIVGESQVGSHTGQTYYGTAGACLNCGAASQTVHEGSVGPIVTTRDGQQVQQRPPRANGTPGIPMQGLWRMVDSDAAANAAHGATNALRQSHLRQR